MHFVNPWTYAWSGKCIRLLPRPMYKADCLFVYGLLSRVREHFFFNNCSFTSETIFENKCEGSLLGYKLWRHGQKDYSFWLLVCKKKKVWNVFWTTSQLLNSMDVHDRVKFNTWHNRNIFAPCKVIQLTQSWILDSTLSDFHCRLDTGFWTLLSVEFGFEILIGNGSPLRFLVLNFKFQGRGLRISQKISWIPEPRLPYTGLHDLIFVSACLFSFQNARDFVLGTNNCPWVDKWWWPRTR